MDMEEWESTKKSIVNYYHNSWPGYSNFISKVNLGLHYGYYDKGNKSHNKAMLNMNNQVALALKLKKESCYTILDAGCGVGGTMIYLAKNYPNTILIGINISNEQIEYANKFSEQREVKDQVTFLKRDYLNTGFPDKTFDAVYAIESMCHAYDKHIFVKEVKRILKPEGRLVILDGFRNGEYPSKPSLEKQYALMCEGWAMRYKLDTQFRFKRYLEEEGFQDIVYRDITANILQSSRRVYKVSIMLYFLRLISGYSYRNISRAGLYQKKLFKTRYIIYAVFSAQKSS
jgi:ubiquinone/menaquinone biosynthesis C-methylase UbiE